MITGCERRGRRHAPPARASSAGLHFASVGDDLIVLDVAADEYRCAIGQAGRLPPGVEPVRVPTLQADLSDARAAGRLTAIRILDFAVATLWVAATFKRYSFARLIAASSSGRATRPPTRAGVSDEVAAFERLRFWTPLDDDCLFRSFWLKAFLRRRGCDVSWVFGVRTYPFLAHCWLQSGSVALDDHFQRLTGYTPIMIVR